MICYCVSALMCIVKPDGPPQLCKTDEIGEIVINSRAGGTMYYGLPGVTKNTFEVCRCALGLAVSFGPTTLCTV